MNKEHKQELNRLYIEYTAQRCPETYRDKPAAIIPPIWSDKTANKLTTAILSFLKYSGWQAERINTTGRVIRARSGKQIYIPTAGVRGSADISATIAGRSVKIEVKIGRDRQSDEQRKYQESVTRAGGQYWLVRDFAEFMQKYEDNFQNNTTNEKSRNL